MPDQGQVRIRLANNADVAAIRAVEASTPLVIGDVSLTIDRGEDWFAPTRLMEEVVTLVIEVGGTVAGFCCGARHRARIGGIDRWMLYVHQARVLPDHQSRGLGIQLVADLFARYRDRGNDSAYWFIARDNKASQAFAGESFNKWSAGPYRVTLPTAALAAPPTGRPAEESDAARVVEILNAGHDGEEFFLPYTVESLTSRLTRAQEIYSWSSLVLGEAAVVGIWSLAYDVRRSGAGDADGQQESAVLDYGAMPGNEAELEALLRAACGRAEQRGIGGLGLLCSEGSRAHEVIARVGADRTDLNVWTPSLPEPANAGASGIYVDPIYF